MRNAGFPALFLLLLAAGATWPILTRSASAADADPVRVSFGRCISADCGSNVNPAAAGDALFQSTWQKCLADELGHPVRLAADGSSPAGIWLDVSLSDAKLTDGGSGKAVTVVSHRDGQFFSVTTGNAASPIPVDIYRRMCHDFAADVKHDYLDIFKTAL